MRAFTEYSTREWLTAQPVVHAFKQARDQSLQCAYRTLRPRDLALFLEQTQACRGKTIALVVAFNRAWVIDWLTRMAARNVRDTTWLVFDNSRQRTARGEVEWLCRDRAIPYLSLPSNPVRHPCRSHGMAMTWIYHNVVRVLQPRRFAFIDHDLIPLDKVDFNAALGEQPVYGVPLNGSAGWSLWAGYCLFDFAAVEGLPLDFNIETPRGLDTGGRNWKHVYQHFDRSKLRFAESRYVDVIEPGSGQKRSMQLVDGRWLHLEGSSYHQSYREMFDFYERLAKATDAGATLRELIPSR